MLHYKPVYVAVETSLGTVDRIEFATFGRFPSPPRVPGWIYDASQDAYLRADSDANIQAELEDLQRYFSALTLANGAPHPDRRTFGKWVRLGPDERAVTEHDRTYRRAVVMRDGRLTHDMVKARECHRAQLRRQRSLAMGELDARWMRANGQNKKAEIAAIEGERQKWRDAPANPRIEAAKTIEDLRQVALE